MRSSTRRRTIGVLLGTSLAAGPVLADCGPQALGTSRTWHSSVNRRRTVGAPAYRFPFLEETPTLMAALKEQGITVMSVDAGIDDWLPEQTPQMLADRLVDRLQRSGGGIVLLHDAQDQTAQALPLLLDTLKERGYRVVHLEWEGS